MSPFHGRAGFAWAIILLAASLLLLRGVREAPAAAVA